MSRWYFALAIPHSSGHSSTAWSLLLVAQDGPRPDHRDDPPQIEACRRVLERVDWPCEVRWNRAESNLGCRHRMATAISWGFAQSERLIILEDDCLPADSFFPFCEQLLEHYADEPRVMLVSGNHFQPRPRGEGSYYFSKFAHIWGWASWRRAWKGFDLEMNAWEQARRERSLRPWCCGEDEYRYWVELFDRQQRGEIDTWDFAWFFNCWVRSGLTALPNVNLVSNIGFGPQATHTRDATSRWARLATGELTELRHPPQIVRDRLADQWTWNHIFRPIPASGGHRPQRGGRLSRWWRRRSTAA